MILRQALDYELGQSGHVVAGNPGREDQADRLRGEPPRHEPQRLGRGLVKPLLVIDQADQRPVPGSL
jgi:hypothetical protein